MDIRRLRLLRPPLIAGALLATNALLAAGLVALALRPRPIVVHPAARGDAELIPGALPESAAREFAIRYVLHLDNFTPSTLEASQEILKRMISPRSWAGANESLEKRKRVVIEGRMSSQVLVLSSGAVGTTVRVDALRRTFISDRLSREVKLRYEIVLEKQPATEPNPFGLGVVSQSIQEELDPRESNPGGNGGRRDDDK